MSSIGSENGGDVLKMIIALLIMEVLLGQGGQGEGGGEESGFDLLEMLKQGAGGGLQSLSLSFESQTTTMQLDSSSVASTSSQHAAASYQQQASAASSPASGSVSAIA